MTDIDRIFPTRLNFPVAETAMKIEVDAIRQGWGASNAGSWCTVKQFSDYVKVTAKANTTSQPRSASMIIMSGDDMDDVEDITIEQSCKFNASNLILPQKQENSTGCAVTCVAMCVCQTLKQFQKDGFSISYVYDWGKIAATYGYTYEEIKNSPLENVYNFLKEGYPVIVYSNDGNNGKTEHWVTVYQYTGTSTSGSNVKASDFMCVDPWLGNKCRLDQSTNFNNDLTTTRIVVYKQKVFQ